DNFTILDHVAPHCDSYELYKSVLGQESKVVFNGTIIVEQDAQKTNAIQSNQSLLLSEEAQSFAKPQLKIWADDVKCTHGATAGNLDQDSLFYLRARGIPAPEAKRLLVEAFAGEVLTHVKNKTVQSFLQEKIFQKLIEIF
ncbi:MAG: SufD family Fe-S cluster assembly protein, partial [Candidatus Paceibacterota bacterium]